MRHSIIPAFAAISALSLGACVTPENPEQIIRTIAEDQIVDQTRAASIGHSRVRIDSTARLFQGLRTLEYNALARAAIEARAADAPYFVISYLDYDNKTPSMFSSNVGMPASGWIGTYEDLLARRELATLGEDLPSGVGIQKITMVVRLLSDQERGERDAFSAEDTFESLLTERIDRKGIDAPKRLSIKSLFGGNGDLEGDGN